MELISKLLASRNSKSPASKSRQKSQSYHFLCHDLFAFAAEQVQVAVFHECDFRGRKLLFDSKSVEKVIADNNKGDKNERKPSVDRASQHVETANGFCYFLKKPSTDISNLEEMIFGSVAMSYRGTLYKIHNVDLPPRLVLSQVFPSPRTRHSAVHQTSLPSRSAEYSHRLDDSGASASSQTSYSDQSNSDRLSTASDTLFICRRRQQSVPLDVPHYSSLVSSSGYGGDLSTSSLSSGPQSMVIDDCKLSHSFSDNSTHRSLPTSMCLGEDIKTLRHRRGSKLGLAIILQITGEEENRLDNFIMQHMPLIETFLKRVRQEVEIAYVHHHTFVSAMFEVSRNAAQWFVDLLTILGSNVNVWHKLCDCDIPVSIRCDAKHLSGESPVHTRCSEPRGLRTLTKKFFKADRFSQSVSWKIEQMETFIRDLCELVEEYDVKHTNFFLSTLMTGVLTHHLGWVATILPSEDIKCKRPSSAVIRQLCDLYGCVGYPSKLAHTIITGSNAEELINKIINVLTYFIRCSDIKTTGFERRNVEEDEIEADKVCVDCEVNPNSNWNTGADIPIPSEVAPSRVGGERKSYNLVTNDTESFQMHKAPTIKSPSFNPMGMKKMRTCLGDLSKLEETQENELPLYPVSNEQTKDEPKVLFVLGADERLEKLNKREKESKIFHDEDFERNTSAHIKPSISYTNLNFEGVKPKRAQSEEPSQAPSVKESKTAKYKYSGVKFNFQQHPQIFENYMKSKNIELSEMQLQSKEDFICGHEQMSSLDFSKYGDTDDTDDDEPLQTPSNATELEYTSELVLPTPCKANAKETVEIGRKSNEFVRRSLSNTLVIPEAQVTPLRTIELKMPSFNIIPEPQNSLEYTSTLIRTCSDRYMPNIALQGLVNPPKNWQTILKKDLILSAKHPISGGSVEESVAIVANIDSWAVNVISSHTYVIDKSVGGVPVGMSQLVANMLETLLRMWKLHTPAEYCLMHIEQKLKEFCVQSKALAQMLLDTEYCTIDLLTSALKLEVNDVPLLMAVASIHTPEVTEKYGLRFQ